MSDERTYKMLLSDIAGGGSGGGLPDYSEANDGDVLTIDNGEPAWVGSDYDSYDFVFEKIGTSSPVSIIKGNYNSIYARLQNQEPLMGLYVFSSDVGPYNDVYVEKVPLTFCQYYSSLDVIYANGLYVDGVLHLIFFTWRSDGLSLSEVLMPFD